jgi:hypothetical protein
MEVNASLSVITLNVNYLNSSVKWIEFGRVHRNTWSKYIMSTKYSLWTIRCRLKKKGRKKFHTNKMKNLVGIFILISDRLDFKPIRNYKKTKDKSFNWAKRYNYKYINIFLLIIEYQSM